MAANLWRHSRGRRLNLHSLLREDRNSCKSDIANAFFEAAGKQITFPDATVTVSPSILYLSGINTFITFEPAPVTLTPTLWSSDAMKGVVRMTPGLIYIKGRNDYVVFDPATVTLTPEIPPDFHRAITLWTEVLIEGSLHNGPAPPTPKQYGSVFRRDAPFRLKMRNLIQTQVYDDNQPKPVAAEFWEPGVGVILATAQVHNTGTLSYGGIDASVTLAGTVILTPTIALAGAIVLQGTILNTPLPLAVKETAVVSSTLHTDVEVSRSMVDPVSCATFTFDGDETGGEFSGIYNRDIAYTMPDYLGVEYPVFVGFFPSSRANYGTVDLHEEMSAFDNGWYLTMQYLDDADLALLSPANQTAAINNIYRLEFVGYNLGYWFQIGDRVTGATSGDSGTITEQNSEGMRYLVLKYCTHSGGSTSDTYFEDGEALMVGDDIYCYANGHTTNITGTGDTKYPDDRVRSILGGSDWANKTGIEPYRIATTSGVWGGTKPAVDFINGPLDTKLTALLDMAQYLGYISEIKPRVSGTSYLCSLYFIPITSIDDSVNGLDLPAPLTVTSPSAFLGEPVVLTQDGGKKYNKITVWCQGFDGLWLHKTIDDGNPRTIEFAEIAQNIATQTDCDQRCTDLWAYNHMQIMKWQATFYERPDLQKYQKVIFSGYGSQISDGTYRIIDIKYKLADGGTTNTQECTLMLDSQFGAYLALNRVFTDSISMVGALIQNAILKLGTTEAATVISNTDGKVVTSTEFGQPRIARDITGGV